MSNYVKATNFTAKDSLPSGNSGKIIKGTEIDVEFTAIASAISSKADSNSPTLTGTPLAPTASSGTSNTQIATTAFVDGEITSAIATPTITGGTINNAIIGGTTPAAITGTTITANTNFIGNLTGNVTGNLTGNVTGTVSGNAGTVTNGVYTNNFTGSNQSLTGDGYQKLPGGLIIQWGFVPDAGSTTAINVSFPIAFPNACFSVVTQLNNNAANYQAITVGSVTTTGFILRWDALVLGAYYIAIGH